LSTIGKNRAIPRAKSEVVSNLMDAGKTIFGIIDKKE